MINKTSYKIKTNKNKIFPNTKKYKKNNNNRKIWHKNRNSNKINNKNHHQAVVLQVLLQVQVAPHLTIQILMIINRNKIQDLVRKEKNDFMLISFMTYTLIVVIIL